jgi:hypothetical protein
MSNPHYATRPPAPDVGTVKEGLKPILCIARQDQSESQVAPDGASNQAFAPLRLRWDRRAAPPLASVAG